MTWSEAIIALAETISSWVVDKTVKSGHLVLHVIDMAPIPGKPLLELQVNEKELLLLEPSEFSANKIPTTVYLYAYPTLRRVVLSGPFEGDTWKVLSSDGVPLNYDWNKEDFLDLVSILAEPHATSGL